MGKNEPKRDNLVSQSLLSLLGPVYKVGPWWHLGTWQWTHSLTYKSRSVCLDCTNHVNYAGRLLSFFEFGGMIVAGQRVPAWPATYENLGCWVSSQARNIVHTLLNFVVLEKGAFLCLLTGGRGLRRPMCGFVQTLLSLSCWFRHICFNYNKPEPRIPKCVHGPGTLQTINNSQHEGSSELAKLCLVTEAVGLRAQDMCWACRDTEGAGTNLSQGAGVFVPGGCSPWWSGWIHVEYSLAYPQGPSHWNWAENHPLLLSPREWKGKSKHLPQWLDSRSELSKPPSWAFSG